MSNANSIIARIRQHVPIGNIDHDTELADVFDSMIFLDFFIDLEARYGSLISLDDLANCHTVADLVYLVDSKTSSS